MTPTTVAVVAGVLVVVLLAGERFQNRLRAPAKMAASMGFVVVAVERGAADSPYGRWVLGALVLSAIGDAALLSDAPRWFLGGLASFLLAHLAYAAGFAGLGLDGRVTAGASAAVTVVAAFVVLRLWPHVPRSMRAPVAAYAAVISVMVAAAAGAVGSGGDPRLLVAAIGFYLSDLAVARQRFLAPGFVNKLWGLPLYFAAQYLFAWTV